MKNCFVVPHEVVESKEFIKCSSGCKLFFIALCKVFNTNEEAKKSNGKFKCSNSYLEVASGLGHGTICRAKIKLKELGIITFEGNLMTTYLITSWKSMVKEQVEYTQKGERISMI